MSSVHPEPLELAPGMVVWVSLDPTRGREQRGHRPALVVSSTDYIETVTALVMIVPITTVDRGWANHVIVDGRPGLEQPSWLMTEQLRTISRDRITRISGSVSLPCLADVRRWLGDFLDLRN